MADIKISELGTASAVNNTDLFPMTSSGVTVKATAQQIKNYMGVGNLTDLDTTEKSSLVGAINEVNTKLSKTEDLIAYVQTTLTASKAYAVGEQFVYNGLLYKATATIAQGGTITIGGNCTLADSVTEQINTINNSIEIKSYTKVKNGVTYDLVLMGMMGLFSIRTGSFTNAVSAQEQLITLSDFSSDLSTYRFATASQFVSTTDPNKRFLIDKDYAFIKAAESWETAYSPRGCCTVFLKK